MPAAASTRLSEADVQHIVKYDLGRHLDEGFFERALTDAKSTGERDTDFSNLAPFARGRVEFAMTLDNLASWLQDQGNKYHEAWPLFQRALTIKEKHLGAVRPYFLSDDESCRLLKLILRHLPCQI